MIGTQVRELSDGEELVVEGLPARSQLDPRERVIETRRLALDHQRDTFPSQGEKS
jgi:hypothetical protein